jgi:hypothetical protein
MALTYFGILSQPGSIYDVVVDQNASDLKAVNEANSESGGVPSATDPLLGDQRQPVTYQYRSPSDMTLYERFCIIKPLIFPFMLPLFLVYWA